MRISDWSSDVCSSDLDGGGETLDMLDIGLLHHLQKLARISVEGFNIASLPLRIDGVEGKRTFPRTGKAGDDDQLVAGQVDIDALQIVLARAAHGDMSQHRSEERRVGKAWVSKCK